MLIQYWAAFWAGTLVGFITFVMSTCNFKNIGWYFHDIHLDKRHVHRIERPKPTPTISIPLRAGEHDWKVTGGYDPELDGPYPEWGRVAVRCQRCGECRRIYRGMSLTDPGLTYGCPGRS